MFLLFSEELNFLRNVWLVEVNKLILYCITNRELYDLQRGECIFHLTVLNTVCHQSFLDVAFIFDLESPTTLEHTRMYLVFIILTESIIMKISADADSDVQFTSIYDGID